MNYHSVVHKPPRQDTPQTTGARQVRTTCYRDRHSCRSLSRCYTHPQIVSRADICPTVAAVHRLLLGYADVTKDTLTALALCRNLRSMTWTDDEPEGDTTLLQFLTVLHTLPLRELTVKTHSDLGEEVWSQLIKLTGLQKIAIWCMEGPPRVLQGWSELLGSTLTQLELGVSAFLYPCTECTCPDASPPLPTLLFHFSSCNS